MIDPDRRSPSIHAAESLLSGSRAQRQTAMQSGIIWIFEDVTLERQTAEQLITLPSATR